MANPQVLADLITLAGHHPKLRWGIRDAQLATLIAATFTGDSGSGGVLGMVPAPASGDAAAGKVLGAGGSFVTQNAKKVLTSNTVASNKISVTIPANTLATGDVVRICAGATTDGSSNAVTTNLQIDATTTIQGTGSDSNTAAHQWTWSAELYYDGTNLVTALGNLGGPTPAYVTGASNAASKTVSHTIDLVAGSAHATPVALSVTILGA